MRQRRNIRNVPAAYFLFALAGLAEFFVAGCSSISGNRSTFTYTRIAPIPAASRRIPLSRTKIVKASYYGGEFAGRRTASGERFDPNRLTAASRTLPFGSTVKVTNLSNGRSVKVRINDSGPYVRGRSLDLSRRAAQTIGLTRAGVAKVRVTPISAPNYAYR